MQFIGEHLLPGKIGHFFALLFFSASLIAVIAYFKAANAKTPEEEKDWRRMARWAFCIDVFAVFAVFVTIIFIVANHLFEYNFAWEHSSRAMPLQYLFSCIWEAQEGSFMLWTIWVCVLGLILIRKAGKWESPVMTVISFTHLCLATMIMGLYFFGNKVGFNPFILTRQMDWAANAPIFSQANYMSIPQMQDGQGLNALLQNYWMTIHPPILFLGFSSTVVPFAYAIAGLWKRQWDWTRAALPWTLFSACVLGTGVMMGAAWAYESLSFGGYWAWDPVENASLVPWLVMIAGLHTMVVYNSTGHSLRATHFFLITQFILVLYSTFLTRSGILGDTSVHAFVDSGMNVQLALFVFVFLIPAYILFIVRYRKVPHIIKEEATGSREFWMFIGALVLFLSALYVIGATSLPVFNLVTQKKVAIGADAEFAYNRIEIFIAVLLGLLTAVTQYLKYKGTSWASLWKKIWLPTAVALVVSVLVSVFGGIHYDKYGIGFLVAIHLALFAAIYSVVANAAYIRIGLKGKLRSAGPSIAHVGFGLMLIGILLSSAKKSVLSINTTGILLPFTPESKQDPMENLTLLKGVPTDMGVYTATFVSNDSVNTQKNITYYHIHFDKKESKEQFDLYPDYLYSPKGGGETAANPDKYHYWDKDIFAYVSATENPGRDDTVQFRPSGLLAPGDTAYFSKGYLVLDSIVVNPNNAKFHFAPTDTAIVAKVSVITRDSMRYVAYPALYEKDGEWHFANDTVFAQNLALQFDKVEGRKIELGIKESAGMVPFVALKVLEFPQIGVLWIGTIIMITGFIVSIVWRRRQAALTVSR
jgi:cytochrome c-type biogenesis protein CcmF